MTYQGCTKYLICAQFGAKTGLNLLYLDLNSHAAKQCSLVAANAAQRCWAMSTVAKRLDVSRCQLPLSLLELLQH